MNYTQKEKLIDKLCGIGLMLICFEIFYAIVNSCYTEFIYDFSKVTTWIYIAGGVILAFSVVLLSYAYIKKNKSKAFYGMETLVLAMTAATLPGTYLDYVAPYNKLNKVYPWLFLVYYIAKAIYVIINANRSNNKSSKKNSKKKKR